MARTPRARKRAAPKSAAPKRAPPARSKVARQRRLTTILERLDKAFGECKPPENDCVLERAIYLVLRETTTDSAARRCLKILKQEFVDWNEVRASRPAELARMMSGSNRASVVRRYLDRAGRVRGLIDQVYNDRNEPSLDFLSDTSMREQLQYLEDIDDLGLHNAFALVQWGQGDTRLVQMPSEAVKAAQQLGVIPGGAVTAARKALASLIDPLRRVATVAHLCQLGQMEEAWPTSLKEFTGSSR